MQILVTSTADTLDAQVDARFGRCAYFLKIQVQGEQITLEQAVPNQGVEAAHGAGTQAAQNVGDLGAAIVLTGNVGPKAEAVLRQLGIKVYEAQGSVQDAVKAYTDGELTQII